MIVHIDKLIRHLRSQIESADKVDSEFVYLTKREAEGCLELAEAQDVIQEMLNEQEAKTPAIMQDIEGIWSTCSRCGHKLRPILAMKMDTYFPKFCSVCGQAVKWDDAVTQLQLL